MDTENDFLSQIKQYSSYIFIAVINIYIIYWIYTNIITDNNNTTTTTNTTNQHVSTNANSIPPQSFPSTSHSPSLTKSSSKYKPKMTFNANGLLFTDEHSIDESALYQVLDALSDNFELFLIIQVQPSKDNHKSLLDKFTTVIEDNIIYKHRILFCNTIEGLCSMIRSIDPIVHIDYSNYVVTNLIRYINEFWFINTNKDVEYQTIYDKVKNDSNNSKLNISELMTKVKCFKELNEVLNKTI